MSVIVFVQGVEVLAKNCPGLTTFLSRGCILIGDDALTHLARYCPRLNTVNIQGCLVISNRKMLLPTAFNSICRL